MFAALIFAVLVILPVASMVLLALIVTEFISLHLAPLDPKILVPLPSGMRLLPSVPVIIS